MKKTLSKDEQIELLKKENAELRAKVAARVGSISDGQSSAAIRSLHEQAHGSEPIRFCQAEPCRSLDVGDGPAPWRLTA